MTYTAVYVSQYKNVSCPCISLSRTVTFNTAPNREKAWQEAMREVYPGEILICLIPGDHEPWSPDTMQSVLVLLIY